MSYIDSSTRSPLAALSGDDEDEDRDNGELEVEQEPEPEPRPRRRMSRKAWLLKRLKDINIARTIEQSQLDQIGAQVVLEFEIDENSRSEWAEKSRQAMKFATQDAPPKEYPWPKASNVIYPLIGQAALEFGARTMPAIVRGRNVVKGMVWGDDKGIPVTVNGKPDGEPKMVPDPKTGQPMPEWLPGCKPGDKRKRADKIGQHMSHQLLTEMPEWRPQTDTMLHQMPIIGGFVRKTFYEPAERRNYSLAVSLMDIVWDYRAASFDAAPRHTERLMRYPHEIREYEQTGLEADDEDGMWIRYDYGPGVPEVDNDVMERESNQESADSEAPHLFLEQHRRIDLDDDGYAEPYVVTVHARSQKVVRIVARFREGGIFTGKDGEIQRIEEVGHYTLYPFFPSFDGGSYPMGFGHLLKPLCEAINSSMNQMFDAGHLQNTGGGFAASTTNVPSGQILFQIGQFTRVNVKNGTTLRDSILPMPFPGPSPALFQLLSLLIEAGKKIASIQDVLTGDAEIANAPPTTVLALIEQGMRVNTAIHGRIFTALGFELKKLYNLNREHLVEPVEFRPGDETLTVTPEDYRLSGGVEPVADPSMMTDMQRLARASFIKELCWGNPMFDQREVATRYLDAGGIDRVDDLFAPPDQTAQQMAMAQTQAELGRLRAAELKDQTQAFLNMALARKAATAQEESFIEAQLGYLRLNIEALNTQVKAKAVDNDAHGMALDHVRGMADIAARSAAAGAASADTGDQSGVAPTPAPKGPFPTPPGPVPMGPPPAAPPGPTGGPGLPPLPAPGQAPPGLPPLSGGPGQPPGGGQ